MVGKKMAELSKNCHIRPAIIKRSLRYVNQLFHISALKYKHAPAGRALNTKKD